MIGDEPMQVNCIAVPNGKAAEQKFRVDCCKSVTLRDFLVAAIGQIPSSDDFTDNQSISNSMYQRQSKPPMSVNDQPGWKIHKIGDKDLTVY